MDASVLERLLLDRALGVLPADADVLLNAYIAQDPAAAARAQEFDEVAGAARRVLRAAAVDTLPPFPGARLERVVRARRELAILRNVVGLAAAILLGVGLGGKFFAPRGPFRPDTRVALVQDVAFPARPVEPGARGGFWSVERLYERARQARPTNGDRVKWSSPVLRPRSEG